MKRYFVAGTDTDVGKTFVSQAILMAANQAGLKSIGYKPVSAGCEETSEGLRNSDALMLQRNSSVVLQYDEVNPVAFLDPVAPHLAAKKEEINIDVETVSQGYENLLAKDADLVLVEGAGGWRLPLNDSQFLSDFVIQHDLPVVLVVGLKLGCLNHSLLTVEAIKRDGLNLAGWVANQIDPDMLYLKDNIEALHGLISAPCLGVIPRLSVAEQAVSMLKTEMLF